MARAIPSSAYAIGTLMFSCFEKTTLPAGLDGVVSVQQTDVDACFNVGLWLR